MQGNIGGKRKAFYILLITLAIPLVLLISVLADIRQYYITGAVIIIICMIPFFSAFEAREHKAGDLVTLASLCAIAVISRVAFIMLPYIKPMLGIIMIVGLVYGPFNGFLVGAVTAFVSNFVFMQGIWTPWQMFAYGIAGYIMGWLGKKHMLTPDKKLSVVIFGFCTTAFVTGGILDTCTLFTSGLEINKASVLATYSAGLPFNIIHGVITALTLLLLYRPMSDRLNRLRIKYGIMDGE